ncbi:MAG: LemA family protein [Fimbriimonadales bacterium]
MGLALILVVAALAILIWGFNSLTTMRNVVRNAWADIDVQLKRRAELVPNLVETTKGYSGFEREVLEDVTRARAQAADSGLGPAKRAAAEEQLASRVTQILAVVESYPELKASAHFMRLQEELSETESKLASSRQYYNAAVRDFNTMQDSFPLNTISSVFGFKRSEFFSVDEESERVAPAARF